MSMHDDIKNVLVSEEELKAKVAELGAHPNADGFSGVLSRRFLEFANHFLFSQFPRHVPEKVILCHARVFSV